MKKAITAAIALILVTGCTATASPTIGFNQTQPPPSPTTPPTATAEPEQQPQVPVVPAETEPAPDKADAAQVHGRSHPDGQGATELPPVEEDHHHLDERYHPEDTVGPEVWEIYNRGMDAAARRDLGGALLLMQQAQEAAGGVSGHLEMVQGRILAIMDRRLSSRAHFERSIEIRDDGLHRALYAMQLEEWDDCEAAQPHAEAALRHPRHEEPGFNTHAEAHRVLALCAWNTDETELGHEHMSEAHRLARESGYDLAVPDGEPDETGNGA